MTSSLCVPTFSLPIWYSSYSSYSNRSGSEDVAISLSSTRNVDIHWEQYWAGVQYLMRKILANWHCPTAKVRRASSPPKGFHSRVLIDSSPPMECRKTGQGQMAANYRG